MRIPSYVQSQVRKLAVVVWTTPSKKYLNYIRSQAWRERRREHLLEHPKCQICLWRVSLQVHHWTYARLGWERAEDLCAVCLDCHHKIHCATLPSAANDNQLELPLNAA